MSRNFDKGDWEADRWKCTEIGNWQKHVAEIDDGEGRMMLWIDNPGGRKGNYNVKIGTSTRIGDRRNVASNIEDEERAVLEAERFVLDNPTREEAEDHLPYGAR